MPDQPTDKPRLRRLEAVQLPNEDGDVRIGLRDPSGLSEVMLALSPPALHVMGLMDGEHTRAEMQAQFLQTFGQPLSDEVLQAMIDNLEKAHFLDGPSFESYYGQRLEAYRRAPARPMRDAEALGIDADGTIFDEILARHEHNGAPDKIAGIIAPHLDYPRGAPCYAASYGALRGRATPDRVIILGTNHFGRSLSVVATDRPFATPLGTTACDEEFLRRIEGRCGHLREYELDHAREHSIELQVAWLQHLFGAEAFEMVAFLCPDPCGPTGTAALDGKGPDLSEFADALGELASEGDTLLVAGADMSHVGGFFGEERELDDDYLGEVRKRDMRALDYHVKGDVEGFRLCIAVDENPTSVCSAGCMYTLGRALAGRNATLLSYHQAVNPEIQCCVTCAAIAVA